MAIKNFWKLHCTTEDVWKMPGEFSALQKYAGEAAPTVCPTNPDHTINSGSVCIDHTNRKALIDRNPLATDDETLGYAVGDTWTNETTGAEFFCKDATEDAAVWAPSAPQVGTNIATFTELSETTSSTYVLLPGMTLTPKAGTYVVLGSCNMNSSHSNGIAYVAIFVDGVKIEHSERKVGGNTENSISTQVKETVDGTQVIDMRFKSDFGTAEATHRSLILAETD